MTKKMIIPSFVTRTSDELNCIAEKHWKLQMSQEEAEEERVCASYSATNELHKHMLWNVPCAVVFDVGMVCGCGVHDLVRYVRTHKVLKLPGDISVALQALQDQLEQERIDYEEKMRKKAEKLAKRKQRKTVLDQVKVPVWQFDHGMVQAQHETTSVSMQSVTSLPFFFSLSNSFQIIILSP